MSIDSEVFARRERNSSAPILRLPLGVLSDIFCLVQQSTAKHYRDSFIPIHSDAFEISFEYYQGFEVKWWIQFSHVCHTWREVAMNTSSLWSHVFATSRSYTWAKECLRRSNQSSLICFADLSADKNGPHHRARDFLRELKTHLGRCSVLSLQLTTSDLTNLLSQTETPRLVDFHYSHLPLSIRISSSPLFGDSILRADSLRRLSIVSYPIDWNASIFHRLTHLKLQRVPKKYRLKCHAFVIFLAGMPSLEALDLSQFLTVGNADASHPVSANAVRPHLQHLKHMELDDNPPELAGFLSSLVIPPRCKVLINATGSPDTTAEEFLVIISWAYNHFHPPISEASSASATHQNYWRSLRLFHLESNFGVEGYIVEENLTRNKILFSFCIWHSLGIEHDIENLPRLLLTSLPICHIIYLEISSYWSVLSKSMWLEIFGSISTLESICIEAQSLPFFRALSHDPGDSDYVPFPVLSSVIVSQDEDLKPDVILRSLRWRLGLGAPLRRLVLRSCSKVPSSVVGQLKKVVEQVEVEVEFEVYQHTSGSE